MAEVLTQEVRDSDQQVLLPTGDLSGMQARLSGKFGHRFVTL